MERVCKFLGATISSRSFGHGYGYHRIEVCGLQVTLGYHRVDFGNLLRTFFVQLGKDADLHFFKLPCRASINYHAPVWYAKATSWLSAHRPAQYIPCFRYVTAYRTSQAYGGPEEGGWWYTVYEPIETRLVYKQDADDVQAEMQAKYGPDRRERYKTYATPLTEREERDGVDADDMIGVYSGEDVLVYVEQRYHESETRGRPIYE